jgi:sialidase-1
MEGQFLNNLKSLIVKFSVVMKFKSIFIFQFLFLFFFLTSLFAQKTTVYTSGTEGYNSFRIPAIIALKQDTLLAFAEGRVNNAGDFGDVNIVLKKSNDNGKTWSNIATVVDYNKLQAGNPAPVVDRTDPKYPNGRIFLFYNTGNNHESELRKGIGLREVWYITSIDGGNTWSKAVNITLQVHRPYQTNINPAYNFKEAWRSYANTPGHAIQFKEGARKGRIYVIGNHSTGWPKNDNTDYDVHGFYSDDHGVTFQLSNTLNLPGSNEATAVELAGGKLMINARNQKGTPRQRIVALSSDAGVNWDTSYYDAQLPDPVCQGTLLGVLLKSKKQALVFCNNKDPQKRDNLTLQISFDQGVTWGKQIVVAKNNMPDNYKGDYTGYADLVALKNNKVGILYELDSYQKIVFESVTIKE